MTAAAIGKIVAAEGAAIVVTARAALRARRRKVHRGRRLGHLIAARGAGSDLMTFAAVYRGVTRMAEIQTVSARAVGNRRQTTERVTGRARRNVASAALRAARVTLKTGRVRVETGRNRARHAALRRRVTSRAALTRRGAAPRVNRVAEFSVEAAQTRKRFQTARTDARVTNQTDLTAGRVVKFLRVTADARRVTGQTRARRIVRALVTEQTGNRGVRLIGVRKAREVLAVKTRFAAAVAGRKFDFGGVAVTAAVRRAVKRVQAVGRDIFGNVQSRIQSGAGDFA